MIKDRRRWPRVACHLEVNLKAASATTEAENVTALGALLGIPAVSKNFSPTGLCIKCNYESLRKKDRVYLSINTPVEIRPIELKSEVIWNSGDEIGVNFLNVDLLDGVRLRNCFEFFKGICMLQGELRL